MTAFRIIADTKPPHDVEEAPQPPMSDEERRAFIESLKRAEAGIARGEYTVLNPETFLAELKSKLFPNLNLGPK